MKSVYLGLAIHNHQPLGNFPWVFDKACDRAYLPMLEALERHPSIRVSLHYSGCLFGWLQANRPEIFSLLKVLVRRGQVEMMGGGYYEPILPMIPDADKVRQLDKMSDFLQREFGARPSGMWLAERVWEQGLAGVISGCGLDWTLVDDTAFKMAGKSEAELNGYFLTEDRGCSLKVFPISKPLRYAIPWHTVDEVIGYLKGHTVEGGNAIVVLGDDGEKFGVWPKTYEHCWGGGWVEDFLLAIEENSSWLRTTRLGDYIKEHPATGAVYLPCASYDEMMEWSLPADRSRELAELKHRLADEGQDGLVSYMQGGYWRNFLVKYPEANLMYRKMLLVHEKVYRALGVNKADCGLDHLWQGQCNCPYWHGVFGGVYLSDIRSETYANLIRAENQADIVLKQTGGNLSHRFADFDGDGREELIVEGEDANLYFDPWRGGGLFEWDLRERQFNLLNTVARRPEAYHRELMEKGQGEPEHDEGGPPSIHDGIRIKDADIARWLVYDRLPRYSLTDHFLDNGITLEQFSRNEYAEMIDFAGRPYDVSVSEDKGGMLVVFKRSAQVGAGGLIRLEKTVRITEAGREMDVDYLLENGGVEVALVFCSQWNINLLGGGHNPAAFYSVNGIDLEDAHLDSTGVIASTDNLALSNTQLGIRLELSLHRPLEVWRYPVETVSNSEDGVEKVYQCSCLLVRLPLKLAPGGGLQFNLRWRVQ